MQCPPTPIPGKKGVKPKGFVEAALTTSVVEILKLLKIPESSFIRAIFIWR